ncbi:hypothetical protein PINS_up023456 [Pythium insidiosum]|nr:hypothetical protein PINS_up023456 [Pythium insidiosum]
MKVAQPALGPFVSLHRHGHGDGCVPLATGAVELPPIASPAPSPSDRVDSEPSSFCALLEAASSVEPLGVPPASPVPSHSSELLSPSTPGTPDSTDLRRQRNRISCRKTRLKRKLEQASAAILNRQRQERQQYLLDLRDELEDTNAPNTPTRRLRSSSQWMELLRSFIAKTLHYALMDPEYLDARRSLLHSKYRKWWPKRGAMHTLVMQWLNITRGLSNVDLLSVQLLKSEPVCRSPTTEYEDHRNEAILVYEWKLRGFREDSISNGHPNAVDITGTTRIQFVGPTPQHVELLKTTLTPQKPVNTSNSTAIAYPRDTIYC